MPTDTQAALQREQRLLLASTATAAGFAAVGIVWGWWAQSQIILLDGMYALIGLGLGLLSLRAARLVEAGPTPKYPFGREALAPLVVGIQGVVLLGTFGFAAIDSVGVILEGGSDTAIGAALVYAVVSLLASLLIWWYLRARGEDSELVQAEAAQWAAGWVLSAGMMVGFTTGLILKSTTAANLAGYVDPVLVLVATAVILPTPLRMIRSMYTELLEGRPPREVSEPINDIVHLVSAEHGLPDPTVRMGKLGRKVYLEIDYLVGPGAEIGTADLVRRDLIERLNEPGRLLWINVELHTDPQWDEV